MERLFTNKKVSLSPSFSGFFFCWLRMKVKDCVCAMKIISRLIWIYSYTLRHSDTPTHTYAYASITFIEMKARWKYVDVCTNDKWKIALRFRKIFEVYKAWKEKISFYVLMEDRYIHILCNIFHFPFHLISIHHTDDDDESGRDEQKKSMSAHQMNGIRIHSLVVRLVHRKWIHAIHI